MIFWEHIKGLNTPSDGAKAWTYINFQNTVVDNTSTDVNMTYNPVILFGASGYNVYNKNYILTSHMLQGYIANNFTFHQSIIADNINDENQIFTLSHGSNTDWNILANATLLIKNQIQDDNNNFNKIEMNANGLRLENQKTSNTSYIMLGTNPNDSTKTKTIVIHSYDNNVSIDHQISAHKANFTSSGTGSIYDGSCTATYFNATSDYRAKKDFKLLDVDALGLINKVHLYSFKYKDSNQPSIGIIAQDVQDVNIDGFDLVDNKNATGDNFDYMSIHESKLIYILWKAIQEQQKEIEELKQQLNK